MEILLKNLKQGLMITIFVLTMMLIIDYINILTKGKMNRIIKKGKFRQYFITSFLGSTPGCLGAFMSVSFYIRGLISFGAIAGCMIATSGDEAFIMLSLFPIKTLILFGILFVVGIISAYFIDKLVPILKIKPCEKCIFSDIHDREDCRCLNIKESIEHIKEMSFVRFLLLFFIISILISIITGLIGPNIWNWKRITFSILLLIAEFVIFTVPDHFLEKHIWEHIIKKHIWKIFLWSFCVLLLIDIGLQYLTLESFIKSHMLWVILIAGIVGLIPESGPHLIFVMMFSKGLIPFSILITSSIVQDGHGMLPLLSYTIKDYLLIKLFNLIIGLGFGFILFSLGY